MGAVSKRAAVLGKAILGIGAVVAVAAGHLSIDFNQAMELSHTQAGATAKEVSNLSGKVLELAKHSEFAPKELADGLYRVESAGLRGGKALDVLDKAQKLAMVGQSDLQDTTYALVAAMNSGVKGTETASKTVGTLNAAVGEGNMRMTDLTGALATGVLPAARAFGLGLTDVTSALDVMTRSGTPATAAATRLRMTFSLMAAPTKQATEALGTIGLSQTTLAKDMRKPEGIVKAISDLHDHLQSLSKVQQAQVISQAFGGGRTSAGILTLVQNVGQLGQIYDETGKKAKDFGSDVKSQMEQPGARLKVAENQIQVALIQLGDTFTGPVADAVEHFTKIITDPSLTRDERISKAIDLIVADATKAVPKLTHIGEEAALGLGKGFIGAWGHENPITKILTIGALTRVIGGKGAITAAGKMIGGWLGIGIAEGEATTATGGALLSGAAPAALAGGAAGTAEKATLGGASFGSSASGLLVPAALMGGAGGGGAATTVASKGGGVFGKVFGTAAGDGFGSSFLGKAAGVLKNVRWARVGGLGIGLTLADTIMGEMSNSMAQKSPDLLTSLTAKLPQNEDPKVLGVDITNPLGVFGDDDTTKAGKGLIEIVKQLSAGYVDLSTSQRDAIKQGEMYGNMTTDQIAQVDALVAANDKVTGSYHQNIANLKSGVFQGIGDISKISQQNQGLINKIYAGNPDEIRRQSADNMRAVAKNIRMGMNQGTINVQQGAAKIKQLLRTANLTEGLTPGSFGAQFAKVFNGVDTVTKQNIGKVITDLKTMPPQARQVAYDTMMFQLRVYRDQGKLLPQQFKDIKSKILTQIDGIRDKGSDKSADAGAKIAAGFKGTLVPGMAGALTAIGSMVSGALSILGVGKNIVLGIGGKIGSVANALGIGGGGGKGKAKKQIGGVIMCGALNTLAAGAMLVPGMGSGDKVPALLEPGEVVINRTAANAMGGPAAVNRINKDIPRFQKGGQPGKIGPATATGPESAAKWILQAEGDRLVTAANHYINKQKPKGGGGAMGKPGGGGLGNFDGMSVANWIIPILNAARGKGWPGHITSGYRDPSEVIHSSIVAPQGHSNHNLTAYPGGAVDVGSPSDQADGALLNKYLRPADGRSLVWGGPVIGDWGHFSATGHRKGGIIKRLQDGGWVRVGATAEGLDGHQGSYGTVGGMNFAELLVAGQNAGLRSKDLAATLGLPNGQFGMKGGQKLHFRLPGHAKQDVVASKNDNGSGQGGDPHFKVDIQTGLARALGWGGNKDVEVSLKGGTGSTKAAPGSKKAKQAKKAKQLGLGPKVQAKVNDLTEQVATYAEYADHANSLTGTNSLAVPYLGKAEVDWLQDELDAMWKLRNVLIDAAQKVIDKRDALEKNLLSMQNQLKTLSAVKKPSKSQKKQIKSLGTAITKTKSQIGDINSKHSDLFTQIQDVQGKGAPMKHLNSMPPIDQIGGTIFDVRMQIQDLKGNTSVTDNTDNQAALETLATTAQTQAYIANQQYPVLSGIPELIGAYAMGGKVPRTGYALVGENGPEIRELRGGDKIHSNDSREFASLMNTGGGGMQVQSATYDPEVHVVIAGDVDTKGQKVEDAVKVYVDGKERKDASKERRRTKR